MCGFTGFLGGAAQDSADGDKALLQRMTDTIIHRGPDDAGYWCDVDQRIGLGFRRLSIIDLSLAGHQPMLSHIARYVIVFNGEIYNHQLLRKELENIGPPFAWRGHSDTETLLAGFETWGIQGTVERMIGMFAFAVWDRETHALTLGRDRIGEKPLYYGWQGNAFLFGSELKALRAHPAFQCRIDRDALSLMLRHNCIPSPYSIYQGISKLQPGCLLTVSLQQREPRMWAYWSGIEAAKFGAANLFTCGLDRVAEDLETLLKSAVQLQTMADVPLGAFLSGGIDSSIIAALMQAQSSSPVKTFSIGFYETGYDEAAHASMVAHHLGTDHTELYITADQAMTVIPQLATLYDEPFSDSSQIPTYLISQLARQHVTVSLSGDAGDELFCGYNRYKLTATLWRTLAAIPSPLRKIAQKLLTRVSAASWNRVAKAAETFLPQSERMASLGDKWHKGVRVLSASTTDELYLALVSHWTDPSSLVIQGHEPPTLLTRNRPRLLGLSEVQRMMALDLLTYLPDDILVKLDRAAMGVSLETRVPFLDHRVVEFAWRIPLSMKIRNGQSKWVLRQLLYKYVPQHLIERPKKGFAVPLGSWLRGPLREWAEALLDESRLRQEGFFNPAPIRQKWAEHLSGRKDWQYHLWDILMFQAWLESSACDQVYRCLH